MTTLGRMLVGEPLPPFVFNQPKPGAVSPYKKGVWFQTSRRYRSIARLPEGMTPQQALIWGMEGHNKHFKDPGISNHERKWAESLDDRSASSQFMRVYSSYPFAAHCNKELTEEEFKAFRDAGGESI